MILKFKSELKSIKLKGRKYFKPDDNKYEIQVDAEELTRVLSFLYDNGITKVKIIMDNKDDKAFDDLFTVKKMKTRLYFESKMAEELDQLSKDKDLTKFFKKISFYDEEDMFQKYYNMLVNFTDKDVEKITRGEKRLKQRVYTQFTNDEAFYMKKSLRDWVKKNYPDYMKYCVSSMTYIEFLRILCKYTGKTVY